MVIISTVHRYDKYFHGESHGLSKSLRESGLGEGSESGVTASGRKTF